MQQGLVHTLSTRLAEETQSALYHYHMPAHYLTQPDENVQVWFWASWLNRKEHQRLVQTSSMHTHWALIYNCIYSLQAAHLWNSHEQPFKPLCANSVISTAYSMFFFPFTIDMLTYQGNTCQNSAQLLKAAPCQDKSRNEGPWIKIGGRKKQLKLPQTLNSFKKKGRSSKVKVKNHLKVKTLKSNKEQWNTPHRIKIVHTKLH